MMTRRVFGCSWLLAATACATSAAPPPTESGPPCRSEEVTQATHDRYVTVLRQIFSTPIGAEMRGHLGAERVEREAVRQWSGGEATCLELVGVATARINAELGTSRTPGEAPFLIVRVADYAVFVSRGWMGHSTPAVLLKDASLDATEFFMVGN